MNRPKIISPCNADRYCTDKANERIAEFSFGNGAGGLISLRRSLHPYEPTIELYRVDGCRVITEQGEALKKCLREVQAALIYNKIEEAMDLISKQIHQEN